MNLEFFGDSDIGLVRLNNEDAWAQLPQEHFFVLADGMGGHNAGEVAANETVSQLCHLVKEASGTAHSPKDWMETLRKAVLKTNSHVFQKAIKDKSLQGMGTTVCFILIPNSFIIYGHVGDSRIYRMRKGRLTQLTQDHSLKSELIAKGELDESLASSFPKNIITRAIGTAPMVNPDIKTLSVEPHDLYLLCSDGLTDTLSNPKIQEIIEKSKNVEDATKNLILQAKMNGGADNITIILVKIQE